jgi:cell volume regulation protein A
MTAIETVMLITAGLLLVSVLASKASSRFGVPALLLFVAIGMLAGSEGPGGIWFDDVALSQHIGIVALAFILFSGGLDTAWRDVRPVLLPALSLSTIGVLVSAAILGWFAHHLLGFSILEAILLGAIVSSTDAAAVFSVFRSRGGKLRANLQPLIELESGSNDPMAVFLTTAIIMRIQHPSMPLLRFLGEFVLEMGIGAIAGILAGRGAVWLINRTRLAYDGLYPALTIALVLLIYAGTASLHGSGYLAVYVAGIVLGNHRFIHRITLTRFHDAIAWLMQITMFLALGLLVFPSRLVSVAWPGVALALVLTFVARPLSVFVALAASSFSIREKLVLAWCGLRGAVPIVLATFPVMAGLPVGGTIFDLVFFSVLVSVLLQGTTIPLVARWLGATEEGAVDTSGFPGRRDSDLVTIAVPEDSPVLGKQLVEIGMPPGTTVLLVYRGNEFFAPTGATMFKADDRLMIFTSKRSVDEVREMLTPTRDE